jgi:hypothetical protein
MAGGWFWSGAVLVAMVSVGCSSGPMTLVGYKVPQRQQVAIVIDVSDQVAKADDGGGIATLADVMSDRLKEHGIDSQLYSSKYDHPKPPRVDIFISYYHGTPPAVRWAGLFALSAINKIVLDCKVTLPGQDKPTFSRHFEHTSLPSAMSENDDNAAAESAAAEIVDAILKR